MKIFSIVLVLSSLLFVSNAMATEFFISGGLGYAHTNYGNNSELSNFESAQEQNDSAHIPLAFNISGMMELGDNQSLFGFTINEFTDFFPQSDSPNYDHASGSITQTELAATIRHFFSAAAGTGFYLRADLGLSVINEDTSMTQGRLDSSTDMQQIGLLLLGGGGYALPIAERISLQLEADYARTVLKRGGIGTFSPTVGVIFHF